MLLLYADDIVLFATSAEELQKSLYILDVYCDRWNLTVNESKIPLYFERGVGLSANLQFNYKGSKIEIVNTFCYLGIIFTYGGSSFELQKTLSDQALKAIFTMKKYLQSLTALKPSHILHLFDKLKSYFKFWK